MTYTLPQGDPSLPALPTPVFSDASAARGDHLRVNNNYIWQNFTALAALFNATGKAIDSDKISGYSVGNASGNVPLSNGTENVNLKAQTARALFNINSSASSSILDLAVSDLALQGMHYYSIPNTDPAAPWNVTARCLAIGDATNAKLLAWRYNTKATAARNRVSGSWDADWTYLTDDNGNAVGNAGFIGDGTTLQSGSFTNNTDVTATASGHIVFGGSVAGTSTLGLYIGGRVVFYDGNTPSTSRSFLFPIKIGQTFKVLYSNLGTMTYEIKAALA